MLLGHWNLCREIGKRKIRTGMFDGIKVIGNDVAGYRITGSSLEFYFAGTNDIRDWVSNLKFLGKTDRKDVHVDFYKSAKRFRQWIDDVFMSHPGKIWNTCFIGHSRGGVLAEESNRHFKKEFKDWCGALLFGAPMIGKEDYYQECEDLKLDVIRYEYERDPVIYLPPFKDFKKYGDRIILPAEWWHGLPGMRIPVHLTYHKGIEREMA